VAFRQALTVNGLGILHGGAAEFHDNHESPSKADKSGD
jgi:hypothetical protein